MSSMRKFGTNNKNPNPPWPNQQSMVVVPPGSNSTTVGLVGQRTYEMPPETLNNAPQNSANTSVMAEEDERGIRRDPIMGNMTVGQTQHNMQRQTNNNMTAANMCGNMGVAGYLCGQVGKYVKLEFLFGENTHMEKIGVLRQVGKDFVAIQENGTNNIIVCSTGKIKFINIYEYGSF